jgi:hypothetical protein
MEVNTDSEANVDTVEDGGNVDYNEDADTGGSVDSKVNVDNVDVPDVDKPAVDMLDDVYRYLVNKTYRDNMTKAVKRRVRESAGVFSVQEGILMHKAPNGSLARVIRDPVEKAKLLEAMHWGIGGGHFGQTATIRKVRKLLVNF